MTSAAIPTTEGTGKRLGQSTNEQVATEPLVPNSVIYSNSCQTAAVGKGSMTSIFWTVP
jgi:hypothetical protein